MSTPSEEEARALIERFDWMRNSGICSPTTRGLLDDAEAMIVAALASRVSTPPSEDWEYGWRSFFANGEEYEWLACSSREEAEGQARECQIEEDHTHTGDGHLTYSVWRRRVTTPGPWEPVPAVPVPPTEPAWDGSMPTDDYGPWGGTEGCFGHCDPEGWYAKCRRPAPTEPEEKR